MNILFFSSGIKRIVFKKFKKNFTEQQQKTEQTQQGTRKKEKKKGRRNDSYPL